MILQISSYWHPGETITLDLLPGTDLFNALKSFKDSEPRKDVETVLAQLLPRRLAQRVTEWHGCDSRLAETSDKSLRALAGQVNNWAIKPSGTEGMRTAEVTLGASIRVSFRPRPWRCAPFRGSISSARRSM